MDSNVLPLSNDSYRSAVQHVKEVEEMFEEDVKSGHMRWDAQAFEEFGQVMARSKKVITVSVSSMTPPMEFRSISRFWFVTRSPTQLSLTRAMPSAGQHKCSAR